MCGSFPRFRGKRCTLISATSTIATLAVQPDNDGHSPHTRRAAFLTRSPGLRQPVLGPAQTETVVDELDSATGRPFAPPHGQPRPVRGPCEPEISRPVGQVPDAGDAQALRAGSRRARPPGFPSRRPPASAARSAARSRPTRSQRCRRRRGLRLGTEDPEVTAARTAPALGRAVERVLEFDQEIGGEEVAGLGPVEPVQEPGAALWTGRSDHLGERGGASFSNAHGVPLRAVTTASPPHGVAAPQFLRGAATRRFDGPGEAPSQGPSAARSEAIP